MAVEQGLYKHFKGQFYQVIAVAKHSETQEPHVVYQPMYGEREIWIRPLTMFDETITREGQTFKRFAPASETDKQQFANEQS